MASIPLPLPNEATPQPDHADDELAIPTEKPIEVDLAEWLSAKDVDELVDFFVLHNGKRIKLAAITDREENTIRKASMKVNPQNPKGARRLETSLWRQMLIATSINKASGKRPGEPGFVTPEALANRPTGELTSIQGAILKVSGWDENQVGSRAEDATDLFG